MTSEKKSPTNTRLKWLVVAAFLFLAVGASFTVTRADLGPPWLRLWSLRFLGLTLATLGLGWGLRNAYLKAALFSLMAVFAALGLGEAYLAYLDAKAAGPQAGQAPVAREFLDEVLNSRDINAEPDEDESRGVRDVKTAGTVIRDLESAKKVFQDQGRPVSPEAIVPTDAYTGARKLGYILVRHAAEILAVKEIQSQIVYSAQYHLLPSGWRAVPQHPGAEEAVVFLGCSFTFGEGLSDQDTYPYKVAERLGDRFQVFNYGVPGYGTHQVLALIEEGYLDEIAKKYEKMHVFYMSIPTHAVRNIDKSAWDRDGPCYQLTADGRVEYKGSFYEVEKGGQSQSLLMGKLNESQYMETLHLALIKEAEKLVREKYGTDLVVLEALGTSDYLNALREDNTPLVRLVPTPNVDHVILGDGHPSPAATSVFADKISRFLKEGR